MRSHWIAERVADSVGCDLDHVTWGGWGEGNMVKLWGTVLGEWWACPLSTPQHCQRSQG